MGKPVQLSHLIDQNDLKQTDFRRMLLVALNAVSMPRNSQETSTHTKILLILFSHQCGPLINTMGAQANSYRHMESCIQNRCRSINIPFSLEKSVAFYHLHSYLIARNDHAADVSATAFKYVPCRSVRNQTNAPKLNGI